MEQSYFIIIPGIVRSDKKLSAISKLLFGEVLSKCNTTGFCWAKNDFFADILNCDERSVRRYLKELQDNKYLRIDLTISGTGTERKIYILKGADTEVHRGRTQKSTGGGHRSPQGADKTVLMGGQNEPQGADNGVHYNNKEVISKPKKKKLIKKISIPSNDGEIITGVESDLFTDCKNSFSAFYLLMEKTEYDFSGTDAGNLTNLIKKVFRKFKEKSFGQKESFKKEQIVKGFRQIIEAAYTDKWLKENFELKNINSNFNKVYIILKNGKTGNGGNKGHTPNGIVDAIDRRSNKTGNHG